MADKSKPTEETKSQGAAGDKEKAKATAAGAEEDAKSTEADMGAGS